MTDCKSLIWPALKSYLEENIQYKATDNGCKLKIPLVRSDQDHIVLYVIEDGAGFTITDYGETHGLLYLSNINLDRGKRQKRVKSIKKRYNLARVKTEISLSSTEQELGKRILDAIQAIQAMSYLSYTSQRYPISSFTDEVEEYLKGNQFEYERKFHENGMSEDHTIDFVVRNGHENLIDTIHAENKSTFKQIAERVGFKWTDLHHSHPHYRRIAVWNDETGVTHEDGVEILMEYSDDSVPWTEKQRLGKLLRS